MGFFLNKVNVWGWERQTPWHFSHHAIPRIKKAGIFPPAVFFTILGF